MDEPGQPTAPVAATAVAVGLGSAVALQARINGELGQRIGDGVIAALLSNTGGLLLLSGLVDVFLPTADHPLSVTALTAPRSRCQQSA